MPNIYYGVAAVLLCVLGYGLAWYQYTRNRPGRALALIMLCGLLLRVFVSADGYLHTWDERFHALVAKHLMANPLYPVLYKTPLLPYDLKDWTSNHVWLHKQPMALWTMALSMSFFGVNEFALRLPSILFTTLGIALTFGIGRYLFSARVGLIGAFLYSIHGLIIEVTGGRVTTDHIDVFFLFFTELSIWWAIRYFQTRRYGFNVLCGITLGLAILSKYLPALIVLPIWLLLALDKENKLTWRMARDLLVAGVFAAAVFVPWQVYIFSEFPEEAAWESRYNFRHLLEALEGHAHPWYYHLDKVRVIYGELVYLPLLWFFYRCIRRPLKYKWWMLAVWVGVPFTFFTIAQTKMQGYTLFTAPAIFLITAIFWDYIYRYRSRFRLKWLVSLTLFLLLALPVRYSVERVKPFVNRDRNPHWSRELKMLAENLPQDEKLVVLNTPYPIETMFYTHAVAYPVSPEDSTLVRISHLGYRIYFRVADGQGGLGPGPGDIVLPDKESGVWYRLWENPAP